MSAVDWLEAVARDFADLLVNEEYLAPSEKDVFVVSVEEMKADMRNNGVDLANLTIEELGV